MPAHNLTLELLEECGPLAVSSANLTGRPAATTIDEARDMLETSVEVYIDAGPSETGIASTIVDATSLVGGSEPLVRVLREGAIDRERLRAVLGDLLEPDPPLPGAVSLDETESQGAERREVAADDEPDAAAGGSA
jgi:tRNA A37 threonylcarbamoyladenosine synthetase subunit TsaC/SUA5/YrdC